MDLAKDIFFFVGSSLGILGFMGSWLKPALDSNRARFAALSDKVEDGDFREVQTTTYNRRVAGEPLMRIQRLVHDIGEDAEYLRFGPVFRRRYKKYFNELVKNYEKYRDLMQVPHWQPLPRLDDECGTPHDWGFNVESFTGPKGYPDEYGDHLYSATDWAMKTRTSFKKIAALSDMHIWEIPLAGFLIWRRVKDTMES